MLTPTRFKVNIDLLTQASLLAENNEFKTTINQSTGNFFYDPWTVSDQYKDTVFEKILDTLEFPIGEARIIVLKPGTCYLSHADIDDRYHINLSGINSYLVNLETLTMYPQTLDGIWYEMNAGHKHSAVNFGYVDRIQLVVRKLLTVHEIKHAAQVDIKPIGKKPRYEFDEEISPWLNQMNKKNYLSHFSTTEVGVQFKIDRCKLSDLDKFSSNKFLITVT